MIPLLEPLLSDFKAGTIGWIIQRYIDKMSDKGMRHLGVSHLSALRRLQKSSIGKKVAATMKKGQVIDFAELRRQTVEPSTVLQDMTFIACAIRYAVARWDDWRCVAHGYLSAVSNHPGNHDRRLSPRRLHRGDPLAH